MVRLILVFTFLLSTAPLIVSAKKPISNPPIDYDIARTHEIKPHRRTIPLKGVRPGFNQISLILTVSPAGEVLNADPGGTPCDLSFWPQLREEVIQWKFTPFKKHGKAVMALVEEYIDLVPPERLPTKHVAAPAIGPDSRVSITLERGECYGRCPSYAVIVSTEGIVFQGHKYVVASGRHREHVDPDQVRSLAQSFVAADFYSMDDEYIAPITDFPTFTLSITIDGQTKKVLDYEGSRVGMPAVITELERKVDTFARTERWIEGEGRE